MALKFEVVAKVGEDKNGKAVTRKIGAIISTKSGAYMLKLETIPVVGWDGWAYLNEPKEQTPSQSQKPRQESKGGSSSGGGAFDDLDEDIPF